MTAAREVFLQEILAMDPEFATGYGLQRDKNCTSRTIWNEGNLRQVLGIPATPPSPIHFTIDVPSPLGEAMPFFATRFVVTADTLARAAATEVEKGIVAGAWSELRRMINENQSLRERIAQIEGGFSTKLPAAYLISEEVVRARAKYPAHDLVDRIDGFFQEAGEAMQALVKLKHTTKTTSPFYANLLEHAREEVIQAAGQCIRLLEEAL